MQTLKPECGACGTNNPLDSDYCLECGIRLTHKETLAEGMELFLDDLSYENGQDRSHRVEKGDCKHQTTVSNSQCECARCINCDTRTETCHKHTPHFDYTLQTHKKNSLDHLREIIEEEKNTPFPIDKKLDFRSMQIPDWKFDERIKKIIDEKPDIKAQIEQAQTWPDKMVAKTSRQVPPKTSENPYTTRGDFTDALGFFGAFFILFVILMYTFVNS